MLLPEQCPPLTFDSSIDTGSLGPRARAPQARTLAIELIELVRVLFHIEN